MQVKEDMYREALATLKVALEQYRASGTSPERTRDAPRSTPGIGRASFPRVDGSHAPGVHRTLTLDAAPAMPREAR